MHGWGPARPGRRIGKVEVGAGVGAGPAGPTARVRSNYLGTVLQVGWLDGSIVNVLTTRSRHDGLLAAGVHLPNKALDQLHTRLTFPTGEPSSQSRPVAAERCTE